MHSGRTITSVVTYPLNKVADSGNNEPSDSYSAKLQQLLFFLKMEVESENNVGQIRFQNTK